MNVSPGIDEVHGILIDRLLTGYYPAGSKLPSCRSLAQELGTNSSTVDRAIGRLARAGRVRTLPRRGTFVSEAEAGNVDPKAVLTGQLEELLLRARRLGVTAADLDQMVLSTLERVDSMRRIAVVECNERDLRRVQEIVQEATGVEVQPVLLCEADGRVLDEEFDAVAVPVFHLNDVAGHVKDMDQVVELNLVASPGTLRRVIDVRDRERLVVVAPTARGVQWMTALIGQYFPGEIEGVVSDPSEGTAGLDSVGDLSDAVVVVNNAAGLPYDLEGRVGQLIPIEWEIDGRFAASLKTRIDNLINFRIACGKGQP